MPSHDEQPSEVIALGRGQFAIAGGLTTRVAWAVADGERTWVFLDGHAFVVRDARTGRASRDDGQTALAAPMPATVVSVNVAVGDHVSKGAILLTLEAMKMELPIRAPRDGTVTRIACRAGDLVQPGIPLAELG